MKSKQFVSLIPARKNSKGLRNKNLYPLNGKPLISWTMDASRLSSSIESTFVSSDSNTILQLASDQEAIQIKRDDMLATDNARMELVVLDAIKKINNLGFDFENIVLLQPTSPLRDHQDIDLACKQFLANDCKALISVQKTESNILKSFILDEDGYLKAPFGKQFISMNRQDLPEAYKPNGAIYVINKEAFLNNPLFLQDQTAFYLMDDQKSIDIDSIEDISKIECILQQR